MSGGFPTCLAVLLLALGSIARAELPQLTLNDMLTSAPIVVVATALHTDEPSTNSWFTDEQTSQTTSIRNCSCDLYAITAFRVDRYLKHESQQPEGSSTCLQIIHHYSSRWSGVFEKQFKPGHQYILFLSDLPLNDLFRVWPQDTCWPELEYQDFLPMDKDAYLCRRETPEGVRLGTLSGPDGRRAAPAK